MRGLGLCLSSAALLAIGVGLVGQHLTRSASADAAKVAIVPSRELHAIANVRLDGEGQQTLFDGALSTQVGAALREADLARDRQIIAAQLIERGHLAARVRAQVSWRDDGAHVTFAIDPGGLYRVGAVEVAGNVLRRLPELATVPTLLAGQIWNTERAEANQVVLNDWLARRGVRAEISMTTAIDHARLSVDVRFIANRP